MVFPDNIDYITFSLSKSAPVNFTFASRKPKKILFDSSVNDFSFRFKINDAKTDVLLHISRNEHFSINIPSTVDKIAFTTVSESEANLSLIIEEWGN